MNDLKEGLGLLAETMTERDRFRDALIEIRDIAKVSEGVEFYAMLAEKALDGGEGN
jgi:hypothetical protein|tara:strand:- start:1708 stop:1875 length:168 start_codon:yes stop_codon:yes gene_type:complete